MRSWIPFVLTLAFSAPAAAQGLEVVDREGEAALALDAGGGDADELKAYVSAALEAEVMDLTGAALTFGDPEIAALKGHSLASDALQGSGLEETGLAGISLAVGVRGFRFLRGPELSFHYSGGGGNGEEFRPSGIDGLELALGSVETLRMAVAVGVEVALGEVVVPYLLGRAGFGVAFIDVEVREDRLGALGTETLERGILELAMEAGVGFRPKPGIELGLMVRGNLLGTQSFGGAFTVSVEPGTV